MKIHNNPKFKILESPTYNYIFRKSDGYFCRWGKNKNDDPEYSPYGCEILDLEISEGKCAGKCKFCSPSGTKVNTPGGEFNIEDIQVGDLVIGYDGQTPFVQWVKEIYSRDYEGELVCIEVENGKILKLTPDHEVFLKNGQLVQAKDLESNMEIQDF